MNNQYFSQYIEVIKDKFLSIDEKILSDIKKQLLIVKNNNSKVIIVGNGGSAAIANHVSIDLMKTANIRSLTFSDPSLITCFANDYGYENWVAKAIEHHHHQNDLIILISSSGKSMNLVNAASKSKDLGLNLITLTGFIKNNSLSKMGDINLWIDSNSYNVIENVHQIALLSVLDFIISEK